MPEGKEKLETYQEKLFRVSPDVRRAWLRQQYLPRYDEATGNFLYGDAAFQRRQEDKAKEQN